MDEPPLNVLLMAGRFEVRGTSAYTIRLAENLGRYGVQSQVVCVSAERVLSSKRSALPIREYRHLGTPILRHLAIRQLVEEYQHTPLDFVHVQSHQIMPTAARFCELVRLPYVTTVHDLLGPGQRLRTTPSCRKLIAVSEAVKSDLVHHGAPSKLVQVIPSGVEVPDPNSAPKPDDSAGRIPVVGTAGPLEPIKGQTYFLQAAKMVLDQGLDAEFLIAGAGPEEPNLRRVARRLGIAHHVTFVTYIREYREVLEAVDIFCLPSLQQGLGTVMLEAMALGKPVIASGVGGVYSVVEDGRTGLLIPRGDAGALAEKIVKLLLDPEWARQLGGQARQLVAQRFGVDRMVEQTASLYREMLAGQLRLVPSPQS